MAVVAAIVFISPEFGIMPTERSADYEPVEYTPEEIEAQNQATSKWLSAISLFFFLLTLILLGAPAWVVWLVSFGTIWKAD